MLSSWDSQTPSYYTPSRPTTFSSFSSSVVDDDVVTTPSPPVTVFTLSVLNGEPFLRLFLRLFAGLARRSPRLLCLLRVSFTAQASRVPRSM